MQDNKPQQDTSTQAPIKRTVLDYDDICQLVPFFKGKEKLVNRLFRLLAVDKVNWIHDHNRATPRVPLVQGLLHDLNITIHIRGDRVQKNLPKKGVFF